MLFCCCCCFVSNEILLFTFHSLKQALLSLSRALFLLQILIFTILVVVIAFERQLIK